MESPAVASRVDPRAVVADSAVIGQGCVIHPFAVILGDVVLGPGVEVFPGTIIGKTPKGPMLARRPSAGGSVTVGARCLLGPHAVIYAGVSIGADTLVGDAASIREQCEIGASCIIGRYAAINYAVSIGDRTRVMDHTFLAGNMAVGCDVFIGPGVLTANDNLLGREGYDEVRVQGPVIENEAVIGVGARLLPGIRIGRGAIVGAASLVTSDVAPGTRVLGIPARES